MAKSTRKTIKAARELAERMKVSAKGHPDEAILAEKARVEANPVPPPMKDLVIIRGLPGSGKSTVAELLVSSGRQAVAFAADDYPYQYKGGKFNPELLEAAHAWCLTKVGNALDDPAYRTVIVHNVFYKAEHIRPYAKLARARGHMFHVITVEGDHFSVHKVPYRVWARFRDNWEEWTE